MFCSCIVIPPPISTDPFSSLSISSSPSTGSGAAAPSSSVNGVSDSASLETKSSYSLCNVVPIVISSSSEKYDGLQLHSQSSLPHDLILPCFLSSFMSLLEAFVPGESMRPVSYIKISPPSSST